MTKDLKTYPFLFTVNKNQEINTTTIKERLSRKPHKLFLPHRTDFFMVYLFTDGYGKHMVDFESINVKKNHILFISKGQVHAFDSNETYDGKALIFTEDFFCKSETDRNYLLTSSLFDNLCRHSYFKINSEFRKLNTLFIEIYLELEKPADKFQGKILQSLLYQILLLAERQIDIQNGAQKKETASSLLATQFRSSVEKYFKEQKNVKFYTNLLGITDRTLQMATAKTFGKSPKRLINERVLLEAKRILAYDKLSVKEIAFYLGFEETTNFVKFFKLKSGSTPTDFRKQF